MNIRHKPAPYGPGFVGGVSVICFPLPAVFRHFRYQVVAGFQMFPKLLRVPGLRHHAAHANDGDVRASRAGRDPLFGQFLETASHRRCLCRDILGIHCRDCGPGRLGFFFPPVCGETFRKGFPQVFGKRVKGGIFEKDHGCDLKPELFVYPIGKLGKIDRVKSVFTDIFVNGDICFIYLEDIRNHGEQFFPKSPECFSRICLGG